MCGGVSSVVRCALLLFVVRICLLFVASCSLLVVCCVLVFAIVRCLIFVVMCCWLLLVCAFCNSYCSLLLMCVCFFCVSLVDVGFAVRS